MIRQALVDSGVVTVEQLQEPPLASRQALLEAHSADYVDAFVAGALTPALQRRIGFPWSPELVRRILATVGGALAAADHALEHGIAGNLAGGTHHALADGGEGFCVFNDLAVVASNLLRQGRVKRVAILDLDVHQGNGVSAILGRDPRVLITSVHGERNYPFEKIGSSLDVGLPDGTGDAAYLRVVDAVVPAVLRFRPDLVLYQAGVDALARDTLGRLAMTHDGLIQRDERVLVALKSANIPVSLALGGGYAEPITDTVAAHVGTYRVVREIFG